jgi:hypothetical protein
MDDLSRAAKQLVHRPELTPPPVDVVGARARRYRRRSRSAVAATLAVVVTIALIVVSVATSGSTSKQEIFAGQPSTTLAPPSSAGVATEAYNPPRITYRAGDFDLTQYSFINTRNVPEHITLTPGAVWFSAANKLMRFDPRLQAVTNVKSLDRGVVELTSTPGTVYAFTAHETSTLNITAIAANDLSTRWRATIVLASAALTKMGAALGRGKLWVASASPGGGELFAVDLTSGHVTPSTPLPQMPEGIVATATDVWVGTGTSLLRVDAADPSRVREIALGFRFKPKAASGTSVWGQKELTENVFASRFLLVDGTSGRVRADLGDYSTGFAPVGRKAWITASSNIIGIVDSNTLAYERKGSATSVMNQGPADIHVLGGVGWAINSYSGLLIRVTLR